MKADDFLADVPSADDFLGEPDPVKRKNRGPTDYLRDAGAAVLKIGPTALRGIGDITQMATAGKFGSGLSSSMAQGMQTIDEVVGSDILRDEKGIVNQTIADPTKDWTDVIASLYHNPGALADMGVSTAGSMMLPMGVAGLAGKIAPLTARGATGIAVGTGAVQTAADTFTGTDADMTGKYKAAALSGAASAVLGKVLGGGIEGQLARRVTGNAGVGGVKEIGKSMLKEGANEFGEEGSNPLAQNVGEGQPLDFNQAGKQGALGGILGAALGGGVTTLDTVASPERSNASLLAGAIDQFGKEGLFDAIARNDALTGAGGFQQFASPIAQQIAPAEGAPVPERAVTPATPAPIPQLPYDPAVQNPQRPVVVDPQGNAREMTADEFLAADDARQGDQAMGLTPDVRRAQETRTEPEQPAPTQSDLLDRLRETGWTPQQEVFAGKPDLAPEQRQELDQANAQDLESMYQQEVKDGIKQRLGIDQQQAPEARTETSAFRTFLRDLGIAPDLAGDVTGERGFKANSRMPGTFRKGGLQLDEIVTRAVERGFLTDAQVESTLDNGGTNALVEMIRAELRGERQVSNDVAGEQAQSAIDNRALEDLDQRARAIGFDTKGLDGDQINLALKRIERRRARNQQINAKREALAERQAMRDAQDFDSLDDSDIPWNNDSNVSTEDAMRSLGFSEQEITDAIAERPAAAQEDRSSDGAPGQDASGPAQGTPAADQGSAPGQQGQAEGLTSYTPDELRARDKRIADEAKAEAKQQAERDAADKAARDQKEIQSRQDSSAENFQLGQDANDALSGQKGMFSKPAPKVGDQTQTPEFKAWFGDSKVVDGDGKPLVVYHGTHREFSAFDAAAPSSHIPLPGFYFTPDPDIASTFAESGAKMAENRAGRPFEPIGANVMPAYLSLQNPMDVDASDGVMKGFVSEKIIKEIILEAKRKGHDGVILRGWRDGSGPIQYIVFDNTQIKSATGNRGTFDGNNPDIRFSRPNPRAAGATIDTLRKALAKRFGPLIGQMEARGLLKLWPSTQAFNDGQTSEHIDGPAQGYWDGKVAHLFADGIESGNEVAVLLHEVGEHASMKKMLGPEAYGKLVERAYDLVDAADPTAMRAVDRIPDDTPAHYKDSEFLAYMIEEAAADGAKAAPSVRKWLADIVAAIRAWFSQTGLNKVLDRYGKGIELTPADIAALAVRAVRWQAGQDGGAAGGGQASKAQDQTQTAAFKAWFGDSKVVDGQGKPLVVYHGTPAGSIEAFNVSRGGSFGGGIYTTPDAWAASIYANEPVPTGREPAPTVYPVYVSIQNPAPLTEAVRVGNWRGEQAVRDTLMERGYDGVIDWRGGEIVAFRPEQIKSAIGNRGTFDGGNPDIRYSRPARPSTAAAAAANVFGGTPNAPTTQAAPAGARNTAQQQQPNAASWAVADPGRLDDFIRYIQNSRIDIKRTVDAVKAAGQTVADDANPYLMDELYIGKVRAQLDRLADESVKPLLQAIGNSPFTPEQVNEYLWARHAEERNRQMARVNNVPFTQALDLAGMSTADANTKLAAFQAMPEFRKMQAIARMVDRITTDARTKIVTDGLEEPGVIQAWEGAYKHYVPLQRDMEESGGKASGYNVKGSESRRAVGSQKEAINILANVIAQAEATIIRSEKATVGRSVLDMARQHPNPDFWKVDTPPTERAIDPRTGLVTTRVKPNYKALDNVFTVKEAGVEHFVVFNEDNPRAVQFARTLKNMDAANMGPVMDAIAKVTRYLAQWVTSRNPLFWMTNFARDVQGVAFNLQSTPLKGQAPQVMANIPQALGGFARLNAGKKTGQWTVMAQRFKDAGGQTGYIDQYRDSVERMRDIIKEIEQQRQSKADPRKIGRGVLAVLEGANDAIENGVRLAVFAQAVNDGISDAQAASIAKNISVNFNRKGNATAVYNALYMFMNANIQGNVRMIQGVMQSRRAQVYAGALTLAGAAVALMNLTAGGDDEKTRKKRYELVPEWERERNWIVFIPGTDDYVKIPLPLGPHVLFNAGRILAELGLEDGADPFEKASSFVSSMISAFNPIGGGFPTPDAKGLAQLATPTVARPVVDTVLNQNFAGIPITREGNPWGYNKPAYLNGRENTPSYWTTAAKAMNDWTGGDNVKPGAVNLSPEQLAYLVKGYVVPGIAQTADKVAGQAMSRKDTPMDQIVGVSKFFGSIDDNERRRAGYETLRRDEQFLGEYKNYIKAGEQEKARETLKKWGGGSEANGRKLLGQYNATDRVLSMYRKQKKTAGDEKLDEINGRIDRVLSVYQANTKDLRR